MSSPVSLISGGYDLNYAQIISGWTLKKLYSSAQLSSLTPFVNLYIQLMPGRDNLLIQSLPEEDKINTTIYKKRKGLSSAEDTYQCVLCEVSKMLSQTESFKTKGELGITELNITREVRNFGSARYDMKLTIPDSRVFNERFVLSKLLALNSEYIISYGWLDKNSYSINDQRLLGYNFLPPPHPDADNNMEIEIGQPNLGFWTSQAITLWKFGYNIDQTGNVLADVSFVNSGYARGLFEKNTYVSSLALEKLRNTNIDFGDLEFSDMLIGFWTSKGFTNARVQNFYTEQFRNIKYEELIFENENFIDDLVQEVDDLATGNNRYLMTRKYFDRYLYTYAAGRNVFAVPGSEHQEEQWADPELRNYNNDTALSRQDEVQENVIISPDGLVSTQEYGGSGFNIPPGWPPGTVVDFPDSSTLMASVGNVTLIPSIDNEPPIDAAGNEQRSRTYQANYQNYVTNPEGYIIPEYNREIGDWVANIPTMNIEGARNYQPGNDFSTVIVDDAQYVYAQSGADVTYFSIQFGNGNVVVPWLSTICFFEWDPIRGIYGWRYFSKNSQRVHDEVKSLDPDWYESYAQHYPLEQTVRFDPYRLKIDCKNLQYFYFSPSSDNLVTGYMERFVDPNYVPPDGEELDYSFGDVITGSESG